MSRVLIVQHVAHEGPGWLAEVFAEEGVDLDIRRMYDGASLHDAQDADALVVLGGPMAVYDDDGVPWLRGVKTLFADALERSMPVLGICLGGQLLAVAAGGAVELGPHGPELGLGALTLLDATGTDPLFRNMAIDVDTVQWHWDHISVLPANATLLASSAAYDNQAFRIGPHAWGLQFHPEVTLPLVAQWAQDDVLAVREAGLDPSVVVGTVADAERALLETWTPLLERFARLVANR